MKGHHLATASKANGRRGGFILVAALWLVVALSAVGLDAALRTQARRAPELNRVDGLRAREAATAGSEYARSRLTAALRNRVEELRAEVERAAGPGAGRTAVTSSRGRGPAWMTMAAQEDTWRDPAGLVVTELGFGDAQFSVEVRDTGERLNVNLASEDMLRAFLSQGLRLDYALADRLTQAILDWRDEDELPRINGGERDEYLDAGLGTLPQNRPFARLDELRGVLHMTPELYQQILPYVTVWGSGPINVNAAPEEVLNALPSFTPTVASAVMQLRRTGAHPLNSGELRALLGRLWDMPEGRELAEFNRRTRFITSEVEILSTGRVQGSAVEAHTRTIVARAQTDAVVVWHGVE